MKRSVLACVLLAVVAGCTASASPRLEASNWQFTDETCSDTVPFSFTVTNAGAGPAENVNVRVEVQGSAGYSTNLGSIPAGASNRVSGSFTAEDRCGVNDAYPVTIRISASNAPEYVLNAAISI
jgi:hypothetical protein